ncbi:UNVERIFIED_CONTAM: hypothetical protein B566_EDAN018869 [Ephemera danica]|nr:hypothetical protein B566_EDAN018869 [Ephemera danica]
MAQLTTNEHETQLTLQELDLFQEKDEASYDKYVQSWPLSSGS